MLIDCLKHIKNSSLVFFKWRNTFLKGRAIVNISPKLVPIFIEIFLGLVRVESDLQGLDRIVVGNDVFAYTRSWSVRFEDLTTAGANPNGRHVTA